MKKLENADKLDLLDFLDSLETIQRQINEVAGNISTEIREVLNNIYDKEEK